MHQIDLNYKILCCGNVKLNLNKKNLSHQKYSQIHKKIVLFLQI